MRAAACAALALAMGTRAEDSGAPSRPSGASANEYGCGNCFKAVNGVNAICNTNVDTGIGNGDWQVKPGQSQVSTGTGFVEVQARGLTVSRIKEITGDAWDGMFCRSYLSKYKTGTSGAEAGSGAACVRAPTKQAILNADRDAKMHHRKFATSSGMAWGYPSSYGLVGGNASDEVMNFGTGRGGDAPANWCGSFMRDMLCHVAFPQVLGTVNNSESGVTKLFEGRLRVVDGDSCDSLMEVCVRRQPPSDETSNDFIPPELDNVHAAVFDTVLANNAALTTAQGKLGKQMKIDAWCELWRSGWGLSRAGTGVGGARGCYKAAGQTSSSGTACIGDGTTIVSWATGQGGVENEWAHAEFEAAPAQALSLFLAAAAAAVAMLA
eukprot:TRINITY_DN120_c5_g1_i1.p1 TRINITY_DN120_c5_g1~~TRINITY_DN120_c5_g1_i1.p1  ORF type:complete len:407 (+),score=135.86 TRINITY_DN120_c5_g1_i1:84-1223(+)